MDKKERLQHVTLSAMRMRGEVIERTVWLEKYIDKYIQAYFTKGDEEKESEMQLFIFGDNRIMLENKRIIFSKIAQKHDNEWFNKYKSARKIDKSEGTAEMSADLGYCITHRNIFAHRVADTRAESLQKLDAIGFVTFKDTQKTIWYSEAKYKELIQVSIDLITYLSERLNIPY